ncbi:MAG: OmpH family outer membrane protein [Saprospirales bacterium]|jgi:outer membrane protein|nr:OmpH family outer membrane protein [Saprospirales bacterium]MBK8920456.1 OmpH family outer membrane protein [Saprospirales bacterium]
MIRKTSLFLAALLCSVFSLVAQTEAPKYGHMNLGNLLDGLPETAKAEAQLRVFADSLNRKDSLLTSAFQAAVAQFRKQYDEQTLTGIQISQRQEALEKERQEIQKFEQDAQKAVETKRNELLQPILVRINEAIQAVAAENGFTMIFDVSSGAMLFAAETIDVTALVKKKLGVE